MELFSLLLITHLFLPTFSGYPKIDGNRARNIAEAWGKKLETKFDTLTAIHDVKTSFLVDATLGKNIFGEIDGEKLIGQMKKNVEDMLKNKVQAIEDLVKVAEEAFANHTDGENIDRNYPKAKKLNESEFVMEENEHFNNVQVNLNRSSVHVPTNVYDESDEVLNGVAWSEALDEQFRKNYDKDPTLTWQYFGSATGFFRNYPGTRWTLYENKRVDVFDCRHRGWYIQAATSPKDVVILVDSSGSMTGLRMAIAKATVEKILDTLSDNDFFNVLKFAERPEYVDECFNGTLIQANADNKKKLKDSVKDITTQNIARFEDALIEAFSLLSNANQTERTTNCNKAIMIITDGAPESYEDVFDKYNWAPKANVRIFTYLIGREVGDSKHAKWMACANKGYFSHISTLADVQEHVQDYVHVLSRPMVIKRMNHTIWTNVYNDEAHFTEKGINLMTSVAKPVFDKRNRTALEGILLGVMGTDVPLSEFTRLTPIHKLGPNGYAFAITNNGYVLFHPDFRPTSKKNGQDIIKPNYNSVDIAEVELEVVQSERMAYEKSLAIPNYNMELRRKMINRTEGMESMNVTVHFDDMKRIAVREQDYYFAPIEDTPFSLAIVFPKNLGKYSFNATMDPETFPITDKDEMNLRERGTRLADWMYCRFDRNENKTISNLIKYMKYARKGAKKSEKEKFKARCDVELIGKLRYDANITKDFPDKWRKENRAESTNAKEAESLGFQYIFLATRSGLIKEIVLGNETLRDRSLSDAKGTFEEDYFKRAVEHPNKWVLSVPYKKKEENNKEKIYSSVLTGVQAIMINDSSDQGSITAAVGFQMKLENFYDLLYNDSDCQECSYCEKNETECYLVDSHGYIVFAYGEKHLIGKFLGEHDGSLYSALTRRNEYDKKDDYIYEEVQLLDYQGLCEKLLPGSSSASFLISDPIKKLFTSVVWLLHGLGTFIFEFGVQSIWNTWSSIEAGKLEEAICDPENPPETGKILEKMSDYFGSDFAEDFHTKMLTAGVDYVEKSDQHCKKALSHIRETKGDIIAGREECIQLLPLTRQVGSKRRGGKLKPICGPADGCLECLSEEECQACYDDMATAQDKYKEKQKQKNLN
ncbi:DgyrCDS12514 [Dimorphilus gyrociliatus]|uniref:DgyrCDS12514 n=1 Tax=Dimorphilus gyrociliatus TaxID=2664684 RepID=A0A7I8W7S9_9ANNE|nr:DgyrCDS12514 [Dimorphilus gyrociliatus]